MAADRFFPRVTGVAAMAQARLPFSVSSELFRQISTAPLQTSQSSKEAGRLELSCGTGLRLEIPPAATCPDETPGKIGLPPFTRPDLFALAGGTGKDVML